jgi:glutamate synthase (NADPH/NADH) small chain
MQRLRVPGDDMPGVVDALKFIAAYKTEHDHEVGRRVAVIGAGNTAIDAANAARRLGAEAHIFYRRSRTEMPAFDFEYEHALQEGVAFHWLTQPVEVIGANGRVSGVRFVKTRLTMGAGDVRHAPEPIPGSEFDFACDVVIPALGQLQPGKMLAKLGADPKYYAGGDCVNGGREVVDAVADGKRAALQIVEAARG